MVLHYTHFIALHAAFILPTMFVLGRAGADITSSTIAVMFLMHLFLTRDLAFLNTIETKCLLIFWLLFVFSSCVHAVSDNSIVKSLLYVRFVLCYLALRYWLFTDRQAMIGAALWSIPILALTIFDSWWQYVNGVSLSGYAVVGADADRLTGPLNQANLGKYLFACLVPMAIIWQMMTRHKYALAALLLLTGAGMLLIPLSGERSVTIMLLVATCSFIVLSLIGVASYRRHVYGLMVLCIATVVLLSTQPVVAERASLFVSQVAELGQTNYGQLFKASLTLWQQSPLLGYGAESFEPLCNVLKVTQLTGYCDTHAHNMYLQLLVSVGALGLLAVLALFAALIWPLYKRYRTSGDGTRLMTAGQLALLAGLLFPAVVTQDIFSNWPASIFWYHLALIMALKHVSVRHG